MSLPRHWVKTEDGEYLLLAGHAQAVLQETEDRSIFARGVLFAGLPWLLLRPILRRVGRGRVEVRWRDEVWAWDAETARDAYDVATRVESSLRSGAWVPRHMPQPDVAGAERIDLVL